MNDMTKGAIAVLVASAAAVIWGVQYRSDHQMLAVTQAMFGGSDPTFAAAGWAAGLGVLAFLVGIGLLIGGLVQGNKGTAK